MELIWHVAGVYQISIAQIIILAFWESFSIALSALYTGNFYYYYKVAFEHKIYRAHK